MYNTGCRACGGWELGRGGGGGGGVGHWASALGNIVFYRANINPVGNH